MTQDYQDKLRFLTDEAWRRWPNKDEANAAARRGYLRSQLLAVDERAALTFVLFEEHGANEALDYVLGIREPKRAKLTVIEPPESGD